MLSLFFFFFFGLVSSHPLSYGCMIIVCSGLERFFSPIEVKPEHT